MEKGQNKKLQLADLKMLYFDVLNGYTKLRINDREPAYIKHLNVFDSIDSDQAYQENLKRATNKKLPTEEEQIDYLKSEDLWSDDKEKKIKELSIYLDNLEETKSKLFIEDEITHIKGQIKETAEKLHEIQLDRVKLVGLTAESYAEKRGNEYYMRHVLYKDEECKINYFTEEEFDDLSDNDLGQVYLSYKDSNKYLSPISFKRLAITPFFTNFFYLCEDNAYNFFGKAVYKLTFHQTELFAYARYFKSLTQDAKVKAPKDLHDDPDALIEFYEGSKNAQEAMEHMQKGKGAQGTGASTIVGASKKDLEKMGYDQKDGIDLVAEANKRGGTLSMEDFADIHGS